MSNVSKDTYIPPSKHAKGMTGALCASGLPRLPRGIVRIDGSFYAAMLPSGGREKGEPNQWDAVLDVLDDRNDLLHYIDMFSWCRDIAENDPTCRPFRGCDVLRFWRYNYASQRCAPIGFRPILIPLNRETLEVDVTRLLPLEDGSRVYMGTLYMDGIAQPFPQNPVWNGDIPDYFDGASLYIGNTSENNDKIITWIKTGDILIADRNLLKNVSWDDLDQMGLATGPESLRKMQRFFGSALLVASRKSEISGHRPFLPDSH